MRKLTRTLALLATLALAASAFAACDNGTESTGSTADSSAADSSAADSSAADSAADSSAADSAADSSAEAEAPANPASSLTDDDATLSIVSWTDADLANMIEMYEGLSDKVGTAKVEYVNCGKTQGADAGKEYATFLKLKDKDIDLFCAEAGWVLNYINGDEYAIPVTDLGFTADSWKDAYQYTVKIATNEAGNLMGATWQCAPGGWVYNADLAKEKLGVETPEAMQEKVADWDKFKATAEELKTATDGKVYMTASIGGLWQVYSTGAQAAWIDSSKTIQTDTPKAFIDFVRPYVENGYVSGSVTQWSDDWAAEGKNDETLGYFYSTWCLVEGAQAQQHFGEDKNIKLVAGPQEYFWGGTWLCVAKTCNTKQTAADFIWTFTCNPATMQQYAENYNDFVNNVPVMTKLGGGSYENPVLGQNSFGIWAEPASKITMSDSITSYDQSLKDTFVNALLKSYDAGSKKLGETDAIINTFMDEALKANADLKKPE